MVYRVVITTILALLLVHTPAHAQWMLDGIPVVQAPENQQIVTVVADGNGSIFTVWGDYRDQATNDADVFVQNTSSDGVMRWDLNGKLVATGSSQEYPNSAVPDGAGGVFVVWTDDAPGARDIYAQRYNSGGVAQWGHGGVAVCTAPDHQNQARVVSDDKDGIIIVWTDFRADVNGHLYAQRLNASGTPMWKADGINLSLTVTSFLFPQLVRDGVGGAIVVATWNTGSDFDIYAQRVTGNGIQSWGSGSILCDATDGQSLDDAVEDGSGGVIAVWTDYRTGIEDIYVQRVDPDGNALWTDDGVPVCDETAIQTAGELVADGSGGVFVCWSDSRNTGTDIYGQRLDANGTPLWTDNGHPICTESGTQSAPDAMSDGNGGYVLVWNDSRTEIYDVYGQRINSLGQALWDPAGVPVSQAPNRQEVAWIVPDGTGNAVVVWSDRRASQHPDIFAQRIELRHGGWGYPEPVVTAVTDVPGDQGGWVAVNWQASGHDQLNLQEITHYSVWRAVDAVAVTTELAKGDDTGLRLVTAADITPDFSGSAVYKDTRAGVDYYWEWIGNQTAYYLPGYSYTAGTHNDSTASSPATHQFMVMAHTDDPYVSWPSNAHAGHSVDNLAPAPPLALTAERVGNYVRLDWLPGGEDEPDFDHYSVYRADDAGVEPEPVFFLSATDDTTLWDTGTTPETSWYYIVTAVDYHGTQSEPSNIASITPAVTGIGDTPSPNALTLAPNVPNPFTTTTEVRIGVPRAGEVSLEIFDVAGRRVRAHTADLAGGWQRVTVDARDLPSGVYFLRARAFGETATRKLVIER